MDICNKMTLTQMTGNIRNRKEALHLQALCSAKHTRTPARFVQLLPDEIVDRAKWLPFFKNTFLI